MEALCDRGILSDNKTALSEIAYYNFIQRQMAVSYTHLLGMLAGLAPAYRAMAIKPIEAIRDE